MKQNLSRFDNLLGDYFEKGTQIVLILVLALGLVLCVSHQISAIIFRYQLDYGEAPLVDQAARLANGQNIYPVSLDNPPYLVSNYPPIYLAVLVPFIKFFGPTFTAGRLISSLSALAVALFLGLIIYSQSRDRFAALVCGLLFLSIPYVVGWSKLLRIDMLALGLSFSGLWLLARNPLTNLRVIAGALLLVGAIFTRQSYALGAPLAGLVWVLCKDWRKAILFGSVGIAASLGAFLILNMITDGGFYFHIITANVNEFGFDRLEWNMRRFWETMGPFVLLGVVSLFLIRRWNPPYPMAAPYLIGAALSSLTIGKIGSNINYFLELCAALSLAAGVVVVWSRQRVKIHSVQLAILVILIWQGGKLIQTTLDEPVKDLFWRKEQSAELRQLGSLVAKTSGDILADEYMGFITLQGRPLILQPFEMTQLSAAGKWDQTPLVQSILDQKYSAILITYFPDFPVYRERWTPEMLAAIEQAYSPQETLAFPRVSRPKGEIPAP